MRAAIRYMYGFEFPGDCCDRAVRTFGTISAFSKFGAIAERYEIVGLSELVFKAASLALADCLSDEAKLEDFLSTFGGSYQFQALHFEVKLIGENANKLHKKVCFQELMVEHQDLVIDLFNFLAEKQ